MQVALHDSARASACANANSISAKSNILKAGSKAVSVFLTLALAITMCPAAGLAYAAEGESGEGAAG